MVEVTIRIDNTTAMLYQRVADNLGLPLEQVLADALFKLAGELALEALSHKK